ncbi:MAG: 30S ribosomal protein S9 [Candidatus Sumerlaeia bacterium]|nr:30S ribosomal protein S9 [Candidatus Sumerlaeia bacterium]
MTLEQFLATGRRKTAVARVYLRPGKGKLIINGKDWKKYFEGRTGIDSVMRSPLAETNSLTKFDVLVNVNGGGVMGQVGAIRHGIARAMLKVNAENRPALKKAGFLTRDPRAKERRKYGFLKARKRSQFSKR